VPSAASAGSISVTAQARPQLNPSIGFVTGSEQLLAGILMIPEVCREYYQQGINI